MTGPIHLSIAAPVEGGRPVFRAGGVPEIVRCSEMVVSHGRLTRTMHRHEGEAELVLVLDGYGRQVIGGETYLTGAGDLIFHNSGVMHEDDSRANTDCHTLCCVFSGLHAEGLAPGALIAPGRRPVVQAGAQFHILRAMFGLVYERLKTGDPYDRRIAQDIAAPLVMLAMQLAEKQPETPPPPRHALVAAMQSYMDEHFAEDLHLEDITRRFAVSQYYACRLFKEQVGISPMKYLIRRRVGEAQTLLLATERSVEEVAAAVGYANPNYFSTVFSRVVGLPPKRYRQESTWASGA